MTHLEQDKILLNKMLEKDFYKSFRDGEKSLEIFLTGKCKANCEYCYLKKNQNSLYPLSIDNDKLIIENVEKILKWYVKNEFCCKIDIFSGEWLTSSLRDPILTLFYETFKDLPADKKPPLILCADNMQFVKDDKTAAQVQAWMRKLLSIGIDLRPSASVDGKYCDYGRTECDDSYYNRLFSFMNANNILAHPMVSSSNVKDWIKNYDWWLDTAPSDIAEGLMMLEVRDQTWDDESIEHLLAFLNHKIDRMYNEFFHQDKTEFLKYVLDMKNSVIKHSSYNNIALHNTAIDVNKDYNSCSISMSVLCIRAGDLSFNLCHRTSYEELEIGKFNLDENGEILDMEPTNIALYILKKYTKRSTSPHCEKCAFVGVCVGPCLGNSYENYKNLLVPTKEVCEMYKIKNTFLINKYYQMGLFEKFPEVYSEMRPQYYNYLVNLINHVVQGGNEDGNNEISCGNSC